MSAVQSERVVRVERAVLVMIVNLCRGDW